MQNLYELLDIHDDIIIKNKEDQIKKIIIVTDIEYNDRIRFNLFIQSILEYNKREYPKFDLDFLLKKMKIKCFVLIIFWDWLMKFFYYILFTYILFCYCYNFKKNDNNKYQKMKWMFI